MIDALEYEHLMRETRELTEPVLFPRFFHTPLAGHGDVEAILRAFGRVPPKSLILRVYQDGGNFSGEQARVLQSPPAAGETLPEWWRRMWRHKPTALVLNGVERFHEPLCRRVAAFLAPLLAARGLPPGGIDIALFIGDYGYTPFGVHADPDHAFLIPIGSAVKTVATWSPAAFHEVAGPRDVSFDLERLLPRAREFALGDGAMLFLPARQFHIARNAELSVTMTVSLGELNRRALAKKALRSVLERSLASLAATDLSFDDRQPQNGALVDEAIGAVGKAAAAGTSAAAWLRDGVAAHALALASNGGFRLSPVETEVAPMRLRGATVVVAGPFKLQHQWLADGRIALFVRGACVTLKSSRELPAVLARLNEGRPVAVGELVAALGRRYSEGATLHLLSLMASLGGLEIAAEASPTTVEVAHARC